MSWEKLNLSEFELREYKESLNHRIQEAYLAAYGVLQRSYREGRGEARKRERRKSVDEEDYYVTSQMISYEESRWLEQTEALAARALALLASSITAFLDEQKRRADKVHPPDPKGYQGRGPRDRCLSTKQGSR
jgi:hypothetical protein